MAIPSVRETGISLLESAFCFVLISFFLLLACGIWEYLVAVRKISEIVRDYSSRTYAGIFIFNKSTKSFDFDYSRLNSDFRQIHSVEILKRAKFELDIKTENNILIEFIVVPIDINPSTGELVRNQYLLRSQPVAVGAASIPTFLRDTNTSNGELDFSVIIDTYLRLNSTNLAIPAYVFGNSGINSRYLPQVPLLAIRAIYNLDSSMILYRLGIMEHSYVWDAEVSPLRGDV